MAGLQYLKTTVLRSGSCVCANQGSVLVAVPLDLSFEYCLFMHW